MLHLITGIISVTPRAISRIMSGKDKNLSIVVIFRQIYKKVVNIIRVSVIAYEDSYGID